MRKTQSEFMQGARMLIENAGETPEIASVLSTYGYDEARFKEGLGILSAVEALSTRQGSERGEKLESSSDFSNAWDAANTAYIKATKIARIALDDVKSVSSLRLDGTRKQSFSGWYEQAFNFYDSALSDQKIIAKLTRFGYTRDRLVSEQSMVTTVMKKHGVQTREAAESHASTVARDRKLAELDDYVSDLRAVCEVAFYDDRVELEKLGPLAPVRRKRQAKKPATTVTT